LNGNNLHIANCVYAGFADQQSAISNQHIGSQQPQRQQTVRADATFVAFA
jgi:hypothetical protein